MSLAAEARPFRASRYTTGAILLHWAIALLVLAQLAGGWAMENLVEDGSATQFLVFQLHKSFGITILVLTVARVCWRLFNPPPPEPASVAGWERVLAETVHKLFYVLLVAVPLAGWLVVTVSALQVPTKLFFADFLPWPHLPWLGGLSEPSREAVEGSAQTAHVWLAYIMGGLVALHVAGAVKHHLADGHFVARMLPTGRGDGPRRSYGHATTFLVTLTFVVVMIAAAVVARRATTESVADAVSPDSAAVLGTTAAVAPAADSAVGSAGWAMVKPESALTFAVTYQNAPLSGSFAGFDADIVFDPADLSAARITATVDLSTAALDGTDISAAQLRGPDGLAASAGAVARFEAATVRAEGDAYVADGMLTLRGATVPVRLDFDVDIAGDRATATGTATLDRLAFGIGKSSDPAGRTLAPEVTVDLTVVATRH